MSSRIDCWNLIYHMPPQLRSLFIIKEDLDQWEHLSAGSFRLSPLTVRLIASHSLISCNHPPPRTESVWKKRTWLTITAAHICSDTLPHPPPPPSDPHPPRGLMRRWEHLSRSSLQVLFFCLIGVLLVTINSFLPRLQAALICCHGEKSNVRFHSHQTGSHASYKDFILVFFLFSLKNSWLLLLLRLVVIQSKTSFWSLVRFISCVLWNGNWSLFVSSQRTLIQDKMFESWLHITFHFEVTVYPKCSSTI